MKNKEQMGCDNFEESLSAYIENEITGNMRSQMAEHALKCPLCHSLLNEVKSAVEVCHEISTPSASMTGLEARILTATMPEAAMSCQDFEEHLTDYLDGFLPAVIFHRWERHAAICDTCTDLPGEVVRSIAACYTYKVEELPLPEGLNEKILQSTIGTSVAAELRPSRISRAGEFLRGLRLPISIPQLAPVAMMMLFAVLFLSQTGSNSIGGVYQKSFELAGQTYQKGADIVLMKSPENPSTGIEPAATENGESK